MRASRTTPVGTNATPARIEHMLSMSVHQTETDRLTPSMHIMIVSHWEKSPSLKNTTPCCLAEGGVTAHWVAPSQSWSSICMSMCWLTMVVYATRFTDVFKYKRTMY